jgi:hypothetical protein
VGAEVGQAATSLDGGSTQLVGFVGSSRSTHPNTPPCSAHCDGKVVPAGTVRSVARWHSEHT